MKIKYSCHPVIRVIIPVNTDKFHTNVFHQ